MVNIHRIHLTSKLSVAQLVDDFDFEFYWKPSAVVLGTMSGWDEDKVREVAQKIETDATTLEEAEAIFRESNG